MRRSAPLCALVSAGCLVANPAFEVSASATTGSTGATTSLDVTSLDATSLDATDGRPSTSASPTDPGETSATGATGSTVSTGESGSSTAAPGSCGDGLPDLGESCDDGNQDDGDGCTAHCLPTPAALVIGPPMTMQFHGSGGPEQASDLCPNAVVRGIRVVPEKGPSNWVAGLQLFCGTPTLAGLTVLIQDAGPGAPLNAWEADEGKALDLVCPPDHVAAAAFGSAGSVLDNLGLHCAPLVLTPTPAGYIVEHGPITPVGPHGDLNPTNFEDLCPGAMTGLYAELGSWINAYATECSTLSVE